MSQFTLPELSYNYDALAPHIGAETMELHHSKHHQTYITKLNGLIENTEYAGMSLEEIITKAPAGGIFNNAAQHWNHCEFWQMLSPAGGNPSEDLRQAIEGKFGSMEEFQNQFEMTGANTFGSGWAWLVKNNAGEIELLSTSNADNPLTHGKTALLGVDVWEHAYYVDYRNRRPDYLKALWNVVNWENVSARFSS